VIDSNTTEGTPPFSTKPTPAGRIRTVPSMPLKCAAMASWQDWDGVFWHYWSPADEPDESYLTHRHGPAGFQSLLGCRATSERSGDVLGDVHRLAPAPGAPLGGDSSLNFLGSGPCRPAPMTRSFAGGSGPGSYRQTLGQRRPRAPAA